jgi:hypothetical protein
VNPLRQPAFAAALLAGLITSVLAVDVARLALAADAAASPPATVLSSFVAWPLRVLGGLLVIYGLFAVPGDLKNYENYLIRWWVWVEERREAGLRWQTAFLQVIVTVTATLFDRLFGPRLLSLRAVVTSVNLSLASIFAFLWLRVSDLAAGFDPALASDLYRRMNLDPALAPETLPEGAGKEMLFFGLFFAVLGLWPLSGKLPRAALRTALLVDLVFMGLITLALYAAHPEASASVTSGSCTPTRTVLGRGASVEVAMMRFRRLQAHAYHIPRPAAAPGASGFR